jgi:hypothetical protein
VALHGKQTESGLMRKGVVYFVSTKDGATWVTSEDPTVGDQSGLILPLNAKARSDSEAGVDTPAGAPIYVGYTDASAEAVASRNCASGKR